MAIRLPSNIWLRLWAAVLLFAVGLQAAEASDQPLESRHGSAFSATTDEVAIAPQRYVEAIRQIAAPDPAIPPILAVRRAITKPQFVAEITPLTPRATGPPLLDIIARDIAPRAPPSA